jgi:hypothetical protein
MLNAHEKSCKENRSEKRARSEETLRPQNLLLHTNKIQYYQQLGITMITNSLTSIPHDSNTSRATIFHQHFNKTAKNSAQYESESMDSVAHRVAWLIRAAFGGNVIPAYRFIGVERGQVITWGVNPLADHGTQKSVT